MTRKQRLNLILDSLSACDSFSPRERMLADKIIELEDALLELQDAYTSLLAQYDNLKTEICVQVPYES